MADYVLASLKGKKVNLTMQPTEKDTVSKKVKGLVVNYDDYFLKLKVEKPADKKKATIFSTPKQEFFMKYVSLKSIIEIDEE